MLNVYLLKNQHQAFLDKSGNWLTCGDRKQLFRTEYKDEAINQKVEIAVKQPLIRAELIQVGLDERGLPMVDLPRPPKMEHQDSEISQEDDELDPSPEEITDHRAESEGIPDEHLTHDSEITDV